MTSYCEPDWDKLYISVNACLLKSFSGKPIYFHVNIHELDLKKKYEDLICSFGGCSVNNYNDIDDKTALLVDHSRFSYGQRVSFRVSYLIDCVMRNTLLSINEYVHNKYSVKRRDFMKILFWESGVFGNDTIERYEDSSDECDTYITNSSLDSKVVNKYKNISKHTREMYTRDEKEAILRFIIFKQKLEGLRGNHIWKMMERKGICPRRTYQSMKNHFLKTMINELDTYEFLSETEKNKMKKMI